MNMPLQLSLAIIAALFLIPFGAIVVPQIVEAVRRRSPDSLHIRERLASGWANAKLAVRQKVAAGWRLTKLLGALVWLLPRLVLAFAAMGTGYFAGAALGLLKEAFSAGFEMGDEALEDVDRSAAHLIER